MTKQITLLDVQTAMLKRIDESCFQAKHLVEIGFNVVGSTYLDGLPVSRIADRLLQVCRKAGAIWFQGGWWYRDRRQSLPSLPIGATSGRRVNG